MPQPKAGGTASQTNIMNALILAQARQETQKMKEQVEQLSQEHEKTKKSADAANKKRMDTEKKKQRLEEDHKKTKKELHALKLRYDGHYAFEYKQEKKQAMQKAREGKAKKNQTIRQLSAESRKANSAATRKTKSSSGQSPKSRTKS